jgi:hypothetical protein
MVSKIHEQLLDDEQCQMVSDFDLQDGKFVHIAESHQWFTEQITDKAALITFPNPSGCFGKSSKWMPKSVIGFSPSGDLYVKDWFYDRLNED